MSKQNPKFFQTNPHKAISKVSINAYMIGGLFVVFALIWTLKGDTISPIIMGEIVMAIPLLFISSQAYTKVGYHKEVRLWEYFGWHANNIGDILMLSVIGLFVSKPFVHIAYFYFAFMILLMLIYTMVNIKVHPEKFWSKVYKYLFFAFGVIIFGVLPIALKLV
jgi:hypothetical protein